MNNARCYRVYVGLVTKDGEEVTAALVDRFIPEALAISGFLGATIFEAEGLWQGEQESSLIVEIVGTSDDSGQVRSLAAQLKAAFNQEAVLVTCHDCQQGVV